MFRYLTETLYKKNQSPATSGAISPIYYLRADPSQLAVISIFSPRLPYKSRRLPTTNSSPSTSKNNPFHNVKRFIETVLVNWQMHNKLDRGWQQFTESIRGDRRNYVSVRYLKICTFLLLVRKVWDTFASGLLWVQIGYGICVWYNIL